MPLMLLPAPMKRAADASATNAINIVYSMVSWPCSSVAKLPINVSLSCSRRCGVAGCANNYAPRAAGANATRPGAQRLLDHVPDAVDQFSIAAPVPYKIGVPQDVKMLRKFLHRLLSQRRSSTNGRATCWYVNSSCSYEVDGRTGCAAKRTAWRF
jgi:hypothetical protein